MPTPRSVENASDRSSHARRGIFRVQARGGSEPPEPLVEMTAFLSLVSGVGADPPIGMFLRRAPAVALPPGGRNVDRAMLARVGMARLPTGPAASRNALQLERLGHLKPAAQHHTNVCRSAPNQMR